MFFTGYYASVNTFSCSLLLNTLLSRSWSHTRSWYRRNLY